MNADTAGPEDGPDLVWVLGWGNRLHHENVRWLTERCTDAGYRVHLLELPTTVTDFEAEYIAPVANYVAELGSFRLMGHSLGGLVAAYISDAETNTFLSPFWGFREGQLGLDRPLIGVGARLPLAAPVLPAGTATREAIGRLATDRELREGATRAAPSWLRECRRAHRELPPVPDDAVVFCTLADRVVSPQAIGDTVSADQIVVYDGGHELFSSHSREDHVETLLGAIDEGTAALE